jgi:dephospho-CoA kinase
MIILGLTGSIAMGKSTAASMLRRMGIPVCDSDAVVHGLLAKGGAGVGPVGEAFPGVVKDGAIDRPALGKQVFGNPDALRLLEAILHPLVYDTQRRFLRRAAMRRAPIAVLDVPLLYEGGADQWCDAVLVVSAPRFLQEQRVLTRPGMTRDRLKATLARQMSDAEKRRRADFVVQTGLGKNLTLNRLSEIVTLLMSARGTKWPNAVLRPRRPAG